MFDMISPEVLDKGFATGIDLIDDFTRKQIGLDDTRISQPSPSQTYVPPAPAPTSPMPTTEKKYAGLTTTQWLMVGGGVVALGILAFVMMKKK